MESSEVTNVLENTTDKCREIKKVARFKGTLVFTDVVGRQGKEVQSIDQESRNSCRRWKRRSARWDWKKAAASFKCMHDICRVADTLSTTDAAAGKIKLMTGLSGTIAFKNTLAFFSDTFGVTCKASTFQLITPEQVTQDLNTVDEYIKATVMNVKETNNLKEDSTTNGPQRKEQCPRRHKPLSSFY